MKELIEIQSKLKCPKSQYNKFGNYKYRNAEDILEALKPLLSDNKCFLTISDDVLIIGDRFYIKATAKLVNSSGETIETSALAREPLDKKGMDASQITGSCSSYARKYALNGMFGIDDTKDPDGEEPKKEVKKQPDASPKKFPVLKKTDESFKKAKQFIESKKDTNETNRAIERLEQNYMVSNKLKDELREAAL